jgi:pyrrolysine biosynthesis protein PylC
MVEIAVVGGGLQGTEVVYLARKAGYRTRLIDRRPDAPASGLCDRFLQADVTQESGLDALFAGADLTLPATENGAALTALDRWSRSAGMPLAFDPGAYAVSASKVRSNTLFAELNLPVPPKWPHCAFPVLVKPSSGSGSERVQIFSDNAALQRHLEGSAGEWVVEAYLSGTQHSIEVIGRHSLYTPLQVTDLEMDAQHDCKRVLAPTMLESERIRDIQYLAVTIARTLNLSGIMDLEVLLSPAGRLHILEIDARFPSQTPIAVFWSTGANMVSHLADLFTRDRVLHGAAPAAVKGVILEHVAVTPTTITVQGEHIMADARHLTIQADFFGADEAITNYQPGRSHWVATLIHSGTDLKTAREKRRQTLQNIRNRFGIANIIE